MVSHLKNITTNEKMLFDEVEFKRLDVTIKSARIIIFVAVIGLFVDAGYLLIEGFKSFLGDGFSGGALLPIVFVAVVALAVIISAYVLLSWNRPRHTRLLHVKNRIDQLMRHLDFYGSELALGEFLEYGSRKNGLVRATKRTDESWILEFFLDTEANPVFSTIMMRYRLDENDVVQDALPYSEMTVSHLMSFYHLFVASKEVHQQAVNAGYARNMHEAGEMLGGEGSALDVFGEQFK